MERRLAAAQDLAQTLTLDELRELDAWLHEQISALESEPVHEIPVRRDRQVVEVRHHGAVTYRLELVKCGKCRRCAAGATHGPYWYGYYKRGGRTRSVYIGKDLASGNQVTASA